MHYMSYINNLRKRRFTSKFDTEPKGQCHPDFSIEAVASFDNVWIKLRIVRKFQHIIVPGEDYKNLSNIN